MQLTINNHPRTLLPIQQFRLDWQLPETFGVAYFEPKDWRGLGSLEGAGPALTDLRQAVISAVSDLQKPLDLLQAVVDLTHLFEQQFRIVNEEVGLQAVEVDFAVAGFKDILDTVAYDLFALQIAHKQNPDRLQAAFNFDHAYRKWLDASVQLSSKIHPYRHNAHQFEVQVIYYSYGRVGLQVKIDHDNETVYLLDTSLACPASSYMKTLCEDVADQLYRLV